MYGEWRYEPVTIGSPAVALGFTYTAPFSETTRVLGASFQLVTDANAANRIARLEYLNAAGAVFFTVASPFTVTANLTSRLNFGVGLQQFGANAAAQIGGPLPDFPLCGGLAVRLAVTAIQAGDQVQGISLYVAQRTVRD